MQHRRIQQLVNLIPGRATRSRESASPAQTHHYILGGFTTVLLVAVYIAINTPSASTTDLLPVEQTDSVEIPTELPALAETQTIVQSSTTQESIVLSLADPNDDVDTGSFQSAKSDLSETGLSKPDTEDIQQTAEPAVALTSEKDKKISVTAIPASDPLTVYLDGQNWTTSKVNKGDTLSQLFNRVDLESREAYQVASLESAAALLKIKPGEQIHTKKMLDGKLGQLKYQINSLETLLITRNADSDGDEFLVEVVTREPEIRINNAKATITHTLLGAAQEAGVSYKTIYQLIAMFGWQIDFSMDIQKGDRFSLIYEELFLDDKKISNGDIIAAELFVSGKRLQAIRHIDEAGFVDYFAPNGDGIKGTFLRSPLKFGHITSIFSKSRLHPIQKVWKAHKGVDYGAPRGTPVMATGNGTVAVAGRKGGYGKTVVIHHGGKYETLYAHLSGYAKGVKSGARVNQGDIIGFVGRTGLATGNHLHYEFRIHGIHKNPVTVEFPKSAPIADKYRSQFQQIAGIWISELDYLNRTPLASLTPR